MSVYNVVAWKEEGVWVAHAPALPGVYGFGKTYSQAKQDFADAAETLLDYLDDIGEPSPRPVAVRVDEMEL